MSQILNNIWNTLTSDGQTTSSFEDWQSNFYKSPDVQANVYRYLVENGYTESDADTWVNNINESIQQLQPQQEVRKPYEKGGKYVDEEGKMNVLGLKVDASSGIGKIVRTTDTLAESFLRIPGKLFGDISEFIEGYERDMVQKLGEERGDSQEEINLLLKKIEDQGGLTSIDKTNSNFFYDFNEKFLSSTITDYDQSITQDFLKGNIDRGLARAVDAGVQSLPSIVAAYYGGPAMIAMGVSVAGAKFNEEFAKDPEKSASELFNNAIGSGIIEIGGELITRGLFKSFGLIAKETSEDAAKQIIKKGYIALSKKIGYGFGVEGFSEALTELTSRTWDGLTIEGRDMPTWDEIKYDLGDNFIVGGLVGGTISTVGVIGNSSPQAQRRAEMVLMPIEDKKNIQNKAAQIEKLLKDRSRAKGESIIKNIDARIYLLSLEIQRIKNKNSNALQNLKGKKLQDYTRNIKEINTLRKEIKDNPNNSTVKNLNQENIRLLSEQNKNLLDESLQDAAGKQFKSVETLIDEANKAGVKITIQKGDNDAMQKFAQDRGEDADLKNSTKYGGFIPVKDEDGNVTSLDIFINEKNSITNGMLNTAAHEFFHAAIFSTLKQDVNAQMTLGNALVRALQAKNAKIKPGSDLALRIASYKPEEGQGEEILALVIEALKNNEIEINEGFVQGLRDTWRRFGQKHFNGVEIKFDTDQDVLNFVKDYIKTVDNPAKLNKAMLSLITEGAQGKLLEAEKSDEAQTQAFSKEASDNVQRIYEEQGVGGAFDIINQFKPIVNKIVDKRKDAPNFDRQLLSDEIETGQRGILDLINEYKPESGVPLAAFINKFLPARAIEASRRVLGEEFTEDVTEARGVVAEETADVEVETKRKQKETVVADRLGVSEQAAKTIEKIAPDLDFENLNYKTLKNQLPDIVGELFGIKPEKLTTLANLTKKEIQAAQMFINKNADLLIALLPEGATASGTATGVPNTLLKAFYTKTDRAKAATTGSRAGLAIQQKNDIDREIFLETFGIINGKPDRTDRNISARILAIANVTGQVITNQTVRQNQKALEITQKAIDKIKDGKSKIMFSKDYINEVLQKAKLKSISNKNIKDRKTFKNFIEVEMPLHVPIPRLKSGKFRLPADTYGPSSKIAPGFYITRFERNISAVKAGSNQLKNKKPFTSLETQQITKVYSEVKFNESQKDIENRKKGALLFVNGLNKTVRSNNGNLQNLRPIGMLLGSVSDATYHIVRMMAPGLGVTNVGKAVKREHVLVANNASDIITESLAKDNVNLIMPWLLDNYYQINVNEQQDALIDNAYENSKEQMPPEFYENLNKAIDAKDMSLASDPLIRYTMANVNLSEINWHDGGTALTYIDKKYNFGGSLNYGDGNAITVQRVNEVLTDFFAKRITLKQAKQSVEAISKIKYTKDIKSAEVLSKAINKNRMAASKSPKGITVLDFDDTLATTESLVRYTGPDGETGTLNAEQFANTYQELLNQGYKFDFSEFNKVVKGKIAPLFQKALKLQGKFGPENMFVLTARPPQAQKAIFDFLKANGLNIPLKNITGLGNSTAEAKALWIAGKVGEGYNDFYFADDALQNVQAVDNMLEQFDVKRKVQQARIQFSKDLDVEFNNILENVTGIESIKRFDFIKARKRGASKGRFRVFIPPSHEDFVGLLYNFMGKGRTGDAHRDFFEKSLVRPLNRANREYDTARQSIATDYKSLNKEFPDVKKMFTKKTPDGDFTYQDAIRVYLWDKHGYKIPGLSSINQKQLVELVKSDGKLKAYADAINTISRQETYVDPTDGWDSGDIRMDLDDATGRVGRAQFFEEFNENASIIFSTENLNKIEAGYGKGVKEALEDMLYRIKTGRNRPSGQNKLVNGLMNYLNGSVGSVMFFNMRSALLQQMSLVNYINFADNNIFAAAKAFANQKQYWEDWAFIFNSDMLKQRRGGIRTDVNGAELAAEMRKSKSPHRFLISKLLQLGFLPTQIGDNIAIATGGATYYRNRINSYIKEGMSKQEAEKAAFTDFQDITQSTQQSARPDMVSQQQASILGKIILNFQNVTSQFNRLGKKAFLDIKNRRITKPNKTQMQSDISNAARITYYFAVQNAIFYSLQTALFMMLFGDDEEDNNKLFLKKQDRLINGSIDSILRGSGVAGAVISTLKNVAIAFARQRDVNYNPDESAVVVEALNFSPVVGIKARKIVNAEKTLNYNKKVIKEMSDFDIDNPQWSAATNYVEGFTNAPLNRLYNKTQNVRQALNNEHEAWERVLMFLGWSQYNLNLENKKMEKIKQKVKSKKSRGRGQRKTR